MRVVDGGDESVQAESQPVVDAEPRIFRVMVVDLGDSQPRREHQSDRGERAQPRARLFGLQRDLDPLEEGLELSDISEIEEATKKPVNIGIVDQKLSKEDRLYVYGIAAWIAKMDGVVTDDETSALGRLAGALKIPERPREIVMKIVQDIAQLSGDNRPARYDLVALRRVIGERLRAAQAKRAEVEG